MNLCEEGRRPNDRRPSSFIPLLRRPAECRPHPAEYKSSSWRCNRPDLPHRPHSRTAPLPCRRACNRGHPPELCNVGRRGTRSRRKDRTHSGRPHPHLRRIHSRQDKSLSCNQSARSRKNRRQGIYPMSSPPRSPPAQSRCRCRHNQRHHCLGRSHRRVRPHIHRYPGREFQLCPHKKVPLALAGLPNTPSRCPASNPLNSTPQSTHPEPVPIHSNLSCSSNTSLLSSFFLARPPF